MSIAGLAAFPQSASSTPDHINASNLLVPVGPVNGLRKGNMQQGKALEVLGHALEYLQDSRMFLIDEPTSCAEEEAVKILAGLSRAVFAECAEVKPFSRRWRDWIVGRRSMAAAQIE